MAFAMRQLFNYCHKRRFEAHDIGFFYEPLGGIYETKNCSSTCQEEKKARFVVHFLFLVNALRNLLDFDFKGRYKAKCTNTLI